MKVGLVLSGGGARGIAHFGVIKALQEAEYQIDMIAGTSAGSVAGAMFSAGYAPEYCMDILSNISLVSIMKPTLNRGGMFNFRSARGIFEKYLSHDSFEMLKIPLIISATNIKEGKIEYFESGQLIEAILASSCIPGVFEPIKINGTMYVDGGVLNNLPVEPLLGRCDFLIGSNVNVVSRNYPTKTMKDIIMKSMYLAINQPMSQKINQFNIFINPEKLLHYEGFDLKKSKELFKIGYEETCRVLENKKQQITL